MIKELRDVKFSIIAMYFIAIALLYKYAYYAAFNVDITSFISISDLSVFFIELLPQLVYFFFLAGLICLLFYFLNIIIEKIIKIFKTKEKNSHVEKNKKSPSILFILVLLIFSFYLFYMQVTYRAFPFSTPPNSSISIYHPLLLIFRILSVILFVVLFYLNTIFVKPILPFLIKINLSLNRFKLILFSLTIFYLTGIFATIHAGYKMCFAVNPVEEFEFENNTISSLDRNVVHV